MNRFILKPGRWIAVLLFFTLFCSGMSGLLAVAQKPAEPPALDAKSKAEIVQRVGELLAQAYVFPEKGQAMKTFLIKQLNENKYEAVSNPQDFARTLTKDLRSVVNDRHLRVDYAPEQVRRIRARQSLSAEERAKEQKEALERERQGNFGFRRVEILDGNIGYLDLRGFSGSREAGETVAAAMNFLANSDAVIIDLRQNGGGSAFVIKMICGYFLPEETHVNSWEWRGRDLVVQSYSLPFVPGKALFDKPLYLLTSQRTFSAAEEFTYDLKSLKRAVIVGETTGGGAHPGGTRIINDDFTIWIPTGRAINPITKTNWEGKGIEPDIPVAQAKALEKAQVAALEKLLGQAGDEARKARLKWSLDGIKANLEPVAVDVETLKKYAGQFGPFKILFENGCLYLDDGTRKIKMIPAGAAYFLLDGLEEPRIEFMPDDSGRDVKGVAHFRSGRKEIHERAKSDPD